MLYKSRVKSPYSYMPWSNYRVMRREKENRSVNIIEKNSAEKWLQTNSILATILLKFGDIVDVVLMSLMKVRK